MYITYVVWGQTQYALQQIYLTVNLVLSSFFALILSYQGVQKGVAYQERV